MEESEKIKCEICGKEYSKMGIGTHMWRIHGDGKNHVTNCNQGYKNGTRIIWNKGLTKDTDERLKKMGENYTNNIKKGLFSSPMKSKKTSEETKQKLSEKAKLNPIHNILGKGKRGWYKGYWCDSSWELAYVIYNLDHNIKFERNKLKFEYFFNSKCKGYYPDFILEDGSYVEIKGYLDEKSIEKIKQFTFKLQIISNSEIQFYIKYVKDTYNLNDITVLYENKTKI